MNLELSLAISTVKEYLKFLDACGFVITEGAAEKTVYKNISEYYVLKYTNNNKTIEIAIALNNSDVSYYIKKKVNGEEPLYDDKIDFLYVGDLLFLENDTITDQTQFSAIIKGRDKVIIAYSDLLKHFKDIICSEEWFDISMLDHNKKRYYNRLMGYEENYVPSAVVPVTDLLTKKTAFLLNEGYHLIENSDLLPPYQRSVWHVIYSNGVNIINIHQSDWRDAYNTYVITINEKDVFQATVSEYKDAYEMANHFVYVLKELIGP